MFTRRPPAALEPWTWGEYDAFPATFVLGLAGLVVAGLFVACVAQSRRGAAVVTLVGCLLLLSYPFFGGLTEAGRLLLAPEATLGLVALLATRGSARVA